MITRFSHALFAVLYCFCGTITNTCHTVSTLFSPCWLATFKCNIVHWAVFNTLTAADTSIICLKCISFHEEPIKNRIYRTTHKTIVKIISCCRKRLSFLNQTTVSIIAGSAFFTIFLASSASGASNMAI